MTTETQLSAAPPAPVSFEAFLKITDGLGAEWIDGDIEYRGPASRQHNFLVQFVAGMMQIHCEENGAGTILVLQFVMRLINSGREPDVLFVATQNRGRLKRMYLDGPADLAVEIISPDSVERDTITKLAEYEQGGVREYWLLDPNTQIARFFQLEAGGRYQEVGPDDEGIYRSVALPGFWVPIAWLWQEPQPTMRDVMRTWNYA